jgi:hypothetical protein
VPVVHTFNSRYLEVEIVSMARPGKWSKIPKAKWTGGQAQVVERGPVFKPQSTKKQANKKRNNTEG